MANPTPRKTLTHIMLAGVGIAVVAGGILALTPETPPPQGSAPATGMSAEPLPPVTAAPVKGLIPAPSPTAPPIALTITLERDCFGPAATPLLAAPRAEGKAHYDAIERLPPDEQMAALSDLEGQSHYARVAPRSFNGVTVVASAQHYESHALYFAEEPAAVIAAFRMTGSRIGSDGVVAGDGPLVADIRATDGEDRRWGRTVLICGV